MFVQVWGKMNRVEVYKYFNNVSTPATETVKIQLIYKMIWYEMKYARLPLQVQLQRNKWILFTNKKSSPSLSSRALAQDVLLFSGIFFFVFFVCIFSFLTPRTYWALAFIFSLLPKRASESFLENNISTVRF